MLKKMISRLGNLPLLVAAAFWAGRAQTGSQMVSAQSVALTAQDYAEITQLINRYAYGIDTCGATVSTMPTCSLPTACSSTGTLTPVTPPEVVSLPRGRQALAELIGGGARGCKTKQVWTDWSHLMLNHEITATPEGAKGQGLPGATWNARPGDD